MRFVGGRNCVPPCSASILHDARFSIVAVMRDGAPPTGPKQCIMEPRTYNVASHSQTRQFFGLRLVISRGVVGGRADGMGRVSA